MRLRHPVAPVLVLLRAQAGLEEPVLLSARDLGLPQRVTEKYGLRRYIEFNSLVDRGHWDDDEYRWHVFTTDGREYVAQFLISGAGALHIPSFPDIEGRDEFRGPAFHSAQWDHSVDLTGKRVAVIGTGASAIQIVPEIVGQVAELQLYQRTPPWVVPRTNPDSRRRCAGPDECPRAAGAGAPRYLLGAGGAGLRHDQAAERAEVHRGLRQIQHSPLGEGSRAAPQADPALPDRLQANPELLHLLRAVADPKTELITDRITRITPDGIVTADGTEHQVDVIVYGTGFHVTDSYTYVQIKGRTARTWSTAGTARASARIAGSPSPTCPTCSSCWGPTPDWDTTPWCS